jgi:CO/xanthine dehydrogenase FAD-binding subunit
MHSFEFTRPKNAAEAIHLAGYAKTAQQSADARFVAWGTALVDLMRLEVETPVRLLDINRLPFEKIEDSGNQRPLHCQQLVRHVRAMEALEAVVHVQRPRGTRAIPVGDFHLLPGDTPQRETVLDLATSTRTSRLKDGYECNLQSDRGPATGRVLGSK